MEAVAQACAAGAVGPWDALVRVAGFAAVVGVAWAIAWVFKD